jgi:hypothetical protein
MASFVYVTNSHYKYCKRDLATLRESIPDPARRQQANWNVSLSPVCKDVHCAADIWSENSPLLFKGLLFRFLLQWESYVRPSNPANEYLQPSCGTKVRTCPVEKGLCSSRSSEAVCCVYTAWEYPMQQSLRELIYETRMR